MLTITCMTPGFETLDTKAELAQRSTPLKPRPHPVVGPDLILAQPDPHPIQCVTGVFCTRESSAILELCEVSRIAQSFFGSAQQGFGVQQGFGAGAGSCVALAAKALEEADVDFSQSLATCPCWPQNRQRFLSRWPCCS